MHCFYSLTATKLLRNLNLTNPLFQSSVPCEGCPGGRLALDVSWDTTKRQNKCLNRINPALTASQHKRVVEACPESFLAVMETCEAGEMPLWCSSIDLSLFSGAHQGSAGRSSSAFQVGGKTPGSTRSGSSFRWCSVWVGTRQSRPNRQVMNGKENERRQGVPDRMHPL